MVVKRKLQQEALLCLDVLALDWATGISDRAQRSSLKVLLFSLLVSPIFSSVRWSRPY